MTHFSLTSLPAIRYASDMPFAVGMVLADEFGSTVEVEHVFARMMLFTGSFGGESLAFVRARFPYLVFVAEMVADAEARAFDDAMAEAEDAGCMTCEQSIETRAAPCDECGHVDAHDAEADERVDALAEAAQHEDDMRAEVLDRAAAEWQRKNPRMTIADALAAHDAIPADKVNNNCVQDARWRLRDAIKLADHWHARGEEAPSYVIKAVRDLRSWL